MALEAFSITLTGIRAFGVCVCVCVCVCVRVLYGTPEGTFLFQYLPEKEIETKRIRKEIKTIISCLNHFLSFLSNIL